MRGHTEVALNKGYKMYSKISVIEYWFPKKKVSNDDLHRIFPDYDFSDFEKKVGIKNRYIVSENETGLDLAIEACNNAFKRFDKSQIDYILYCTQSPEYFLPTTACILQDKLCLKKDIGALDFNLGCSGYVYGLSMARALIESKQAKNILLVTSETYSKYIHPKDRSNRAIFGDAASCTIVSATDDEKYKFGEFLFGTDGGGFEKLIIKNGASHKKYDPEAEEKEYGTGNCYSDNFLYMNGPDILNFTINEIPLFVQRLLLKNNLKTDEVDQYIFHQANAFMLNYLRKKLGIDKERFYINLGDGGNTVSSTIPIALKNYTRNRNTEHKRTENILLVGFGVGLSWCGGLIKVDGKL